MPLCGRQAFPLIERVLGLARSSRWFAGSPSGLPGCPSSPISSMVFLAESMNHSGVSGNEISKRAMQTLVPVGASGIDISKRAMQTLVPIARLVPVSPASRADVHGTGAAGVVHSLHSHREQNRSASGSGGGSEPPPEDDGEVLKFLKKLVDWLNEAGILSVLKFIKESAVKSSVFVMTAMACVTLEIYPYQGLLIIRIILREKRLEIHRKLEAYKRAVTKEPGDDDMAEAVVSFSSIDLVTQEIYHKILMIRGVDLAVIKEMIDKLSRRQPALPSSQESSPTAQGGQSPQIDEVQVAVKVQPSKPNYNMSKGEPHIVKEPPPPYLAKPYESTPYAKPLPVKKQTSSPPSSLPKSA